MQAAAAAERQGAWCLGALLLVLLEFEYFNQNHIIKAQVLEHKQGPLSQPHTPQLLCA